MSGSSAIVAINAVMLRRLRLPSADAHQVGAAAGESGARAGASTATSTTEGSHAISSAAEQERHHQHR